MLSKRAFPVREGDAMAIVVTRAMRGLGCSPLLWCAGRTRVGIPKGPLSNQVGRDPRIGWVRGLLVGMELSDEDLGFYQDEFFGLG